MNWSKGYTMIASLGTLAVATTAIFTFWDDYGWVTQRTFLGAAETHVTYEQVLDLINSRQPHAQTADEVEEMGRSINRVYISVLRNEILELQRIVCDSPDNQPARQQLAAALENYRGVSGNEFPRSLLLCG